MHYQYDAFFLLILVVTGLFALGTKALVSWRVKAAQRMANKVGLTGAECARKILEANGIYDVTIEPAHGGFLSDHYHPHQKALRLSQGIFDGRSVAALGIAAHEAGHAIQHAQAYSPLVLRTTLAPVTTFTSNVGLILIPIALAMNWAPLIRIAILVFSVSVIFTLITLPVEFNASRRALESIGTLRLAWGDEWLEARKVLTAAALTYVAAAATAILWLLYYVYRYYAASSRDD